MKDNVPRVSVALALVVSLLAAACNKGAAEEALAIAQESLDDARPRLQSYAPEELEVLGKDLDRARGDLEAGLYTDALRVAQELPGRVRAELDRAERRRLEVETEWSELSTRVPSRLLQLRARLSRLPPSTAAKGAADDIAAAAQAYDRALEAHRDGDLTAAVTRATEGEARLDKAQAALARAPRPQPAQPAPEEPPSPAE